jgi:hypothetical protein
VACALANRWHAISEPSRSFGGPAAARLHRCSPQPGSDIVEEVLGVPFRSFTSRTYAVAALVFSRVACSYTGSWDATGCFRRLSKDYEYLTATSEAVTYLAMTRLLLRRLRLP